MKKYNDADYLDMVATFHETFNHPILPEPAIPSEERCQLRINLLQEELNELATAIKEKNIVEIADALSDLQYVLSGAILEFGMANKFKALFEEVQRSNMSKACKNEDDIKKTKRWYSKNKGIHEFTVEQNGDVYIVKRAGDGKILKNSNYSKADIEGILKN